MSYPTNDPFAKDIISKLNQFWLLLFKYKPANQFEYVKCIAHILSCYDHKY